MSDQSKFKETLRKLGHLISGVVILLKGYSKFEEHHEGIGVVLFLLGIAFILFAIFHEKISWIKKHEPLLFWLEGLAIAFVSYSYFADGKIAIPFLYAFASVMYFIVGMYFHKYREAH
jgi:hypothetical protein